VDFTGTEPDEELDALTTRLYAWATAVADARGPLAGSPQAVAGLPQAAAAPPTTAMLPAIGRYA